jgi:hypothetical protein
MTHKEHAARKPRTHFEQIPVEAVKKIAERDVSTGEDAVRDICQKHRWRAQREGSDRLAMS